MEIKDGLWIKIRVLNLIPVKLLLFGRYWISASITSTNKALSLFTSWHKAFVKAKLLLQGLFLSALLHMPSLCLKKVSFFFLHSTLKNLPRCQGPSQTTLPLRMFLWFLQSCDSFLQYSVVYCILSYIMFMYVFVLCHALDNPFKADSSLFFISV